MPNDETKKTKSEPSQNRRWVKRGLITLAAVIGLFLLWWQMNDAQQTLRLHGHTYHISVMRTDEELQRGLSGTDSLPADRAMLFVFPYDSKWGIWMKDMKYPIDVIWLNEGRQVIHMEKNVPPSSYPKEFRPLENARYVIELASGTIEKTGIRLGDPAGVPSGI